MLPTLVRREPAPADLKKDAGGFDLPIGLGLLLCSGQVAFDRPGSFAIVGELALIGETRLIRGVLAIARVPGGSPPADGPTRPILAGYESSSIPRYLHASGNGQPMPVAAPRKPGRDDGAYVGGPYSLLAPCFRDDYPVHRTRDNPRRALTRMKLLGKTALVTGAARHRPRLRPGAGPRRRRRRRQRPRAHSAGRGGRRRDPRPGPAGGAGRGRRLRARRRASSVVARALEALGRIDILVSNPAYSRRDDFLDYDPETLRARCSRGRCSAAST